MMPYLYCIALNILHITTNGNRLLHGIAPIDYHTTNEKYHTTHKGYITLNHFPQRTTNEVSKVNTVIDR